MSKNRSYALTVLVAVFVFLSLTCASVGRAGTSVCPDYDLNNDCIIDFKDIALIAGQWLGERIDCNDGYEDCDGAWDNGCETDTWFDPNNCGGCGIVCDLANAFTDCVDGNCVVVDCEPGYDDCDGQPENGCEADLMNDPDNCGYCGNDCDYPNATAACQGGSCLITGCDPGYADCDGVVANGCEVNLNDGGGTCSAAPSMGQVYGDEGCTPGPSRTGRGEQWYRLLVLDSSSNPFNTKLYLRVVLQPPMGIDYDLYLYDNCGSAAIASSAKSGSVADEVNWEWSDTASDDSQYFWIEIRYYEGISCSNWNLQTWGDCPP
ncbi:MAG: hypothetical protein ACYS76_14660 [Planctomycetota bacterium]|jgi:hypothetical protein